MSRLAAFFCLCAFVMSIVASPMAIPAKAPITHSNALERRGSQQWMTFYYPTDGPHNGKGALGNCGWANSNSDLVIALPYSLYGDGGRCGEKVKITDKSGKSLIVIVADSCPPCDSVHIDVSPAVFTHFANENDGVHDITFKFL